MDDSVRGEGLPVIVSRRVPYAVEHDTGQKRVRRR